MFERIFGRDKDDTEQAVCAECGRTLLAGEWTRKVTGPNGEDQLICSLCGPDHPLEEDEPLVVSSTPANNGRMRETREDAPIPQNAPGLSAELEAKDAEIASLRERVARAEARSNELARKVALLSAAIASEVVAEEPMVVATVPVAEEPMVVAVAAPAEEIEDDARVVVEQQTVDSSEPGERTWGETPAEFAAEFAAAAAVPALRETPVPTPDAADQPSVPASEDTQPIQVVAATGPAVVQEASPAADAVAAGEIDEAPPEDAAPEPDVAVLALLQRGVDLFNVSRVPRKVAETNEQLGMPSVHVGPEGEVVVFTFMWSMGWYSFRVDTVSGDATMADRGYEEITDLAPNAGVRPDGTLHLAPALISRVATQRVQVDEQPGSRAGEREASEPETPSVVAQKPPEILSKSLLGQRSDGEPAAWEKAKARDFDWNR